ncbi:MAG TPA: PQQ-binding-like beta-propeller repeat protein [Gemmataceae bacterium]|nr:PQQ-binding-like beta-propeller repeat protein [Gemmataceae bacterium]
MYLSIFSILLLVPGADISSEARWPAFRGGPRAGVVEEKGLPATWSTTKNVVWKTDIPGKGWSSPIVWGERIFLTSVTREGKGEEAKKGLYFGGDRPKPPEDEHRWLVYCLDFKTGKILWEREAHKGKPGTPLHIKNSYASETPVTDGERVYAYFGNVGLFCYDMNGKELWSKKWDPYPMLLGWGTAASPVLHGERIYIVNDNEKHSFLTALDKKTGKQIWSVDRDEKSNWATPFVWENEKRTEIVTCGKNKVRSYDLDGKLLWELGNMSSIVIPTPFARHGLLHVSSGYVLAQRQPIFAVRPGALGDISLQDNETNNSFIAWGAKKGGPYNPSPLVYGDYLYVLYDQGMLSCYDARSGKEIYNRQRLGANAFTSSPWAYDGKIFCQSEDGDTFVIQAGPKFAKLGKNGIGEMCMATPAIADGSLIIRTLTKVYRIQEGAGLGQ